MGAGYKIGYAIGWCFSKVCGGIFKLLWHGTVTASKENKYLLITYICLLVALFPSTLLFDNVSIILAIIFLVALSFGIAEQFKEKPEEDRRKYFFAVFEEAHLLYQDGSAPCYLYEKTLSDYATLFAFNSLIPLEDWKKKKNILEQLFNAKILTIQQDKSDIRVTQVVVQMKLLPEVIKFNDSYVKTGDILNVGLGVYGTISIDLNVYPHTIIAGETGSGKSNILKCLIYQSLLKKYDVILIDFKRAVSFNEFSDRIQMYYEYDETVQVLNELVFETKKRLDLFRESRVEDLKGYNQLNTVHLHLKRKIIFIDELAELLKTKDKAISNRLYDSIETLARIGRAAGIHLIVGVQRPDSTIVTGQIKNNIAYRLCGHFVDKEPSRIVLNNDLATSLPNIRGRFIVNTNYQEVQCFYYSNNYQKSRKNINNIEVKKCNKHEHIKLEEKQSKDSTDEFIQEINEFIKHLEKLGLVEKKESIEEKSVVANMKNYEVKSNSTNYKNQKSNVQNVRNPNSDKKVIKKGIIKTEKKETLSINDGKIDFDFSDLNK